LDTQERYKVGREYTPERRELHRAIIQKHLQGKTPVGGANATAVVLGGGPASGKSTLEKAQKISEGNVVLVNPDAIKEMLPEFKEGKAAGNKQASSVVHEESSDVAKMLTDEAIKGGYNLVLDGTGDSSVEKLGGKIAVMRSGGHKVVGKYVSLPTDMAVKLAFDRGQQTGRYVPETYLRATHKAVSNTFAEAVRQGLFDEADLYDTTEFGNMKHVMSAKGKETTIHDRELWERFLAKGRE
jgi:predicted ABC-type ATPase